MEAILAGSPAYRQERRPALEHVVRLVGEAHVSLAVDRLRVLDERRVGEVRLDVFLFRHVCKVSVQAGCVSS